MFYLLLRITSFALASGDITSRELLIPFPTLETCETARKGIVATKNNIGIESDGAFCVQLVGHVKAEETRIWPNPASYDEQKVSERERLDKIIAEAEDFKRKYHEDRGR